MSKSFKQSIYIMLVLMAMFFIVNKATSQNDQLSIDCTILKNNTCVLENNFIVKITDDLNKEIEFKSNIGFTCDLIYGHIYKLIFYSDGCQPKFITIDTRIDTTKERYKSTFGINLIISENEELVNSGCIIYNKDSDKFEPFK